MDFSYTPPPPSKKNRAPLPSDRLKEEKIKGVFSTQAVSKVGTGSTTRRTIQKSYWFARERDDGSLEIQPLNKNYIPSGPKRDVPREEFLDKFNPEPEFYVSTVFPKMKELSETVERGEKHRESGALYSAEFEFSTAVKVDEENVRANFGLGLTYLQRGEKNKAGDIFERLVKLDAAFEKQHKHLFNEFGINLRKSRMYDQSIEYYNRALDLTKDDEHIFVNLARVYLEKGEIAKVVEALRGAVAINPDLDEARQFWAWLQRKGHVADPYPGGAAKPSAAPLNDTDFDEDDEEAAIDAAVRRAARKTPDQESEA